MDAYSGAFAELYDLFYADKEYAREAAFVHECLQSHGVPAVRRLLELACGTGSHALALEQFGYAIVATDWSEAMLARARRKAIERSSSVEFRHQDMRALDLGSERFDAVICLFDSIGYVNTNEALLATFRGVHRHLRAQGLFIFEFWHAAAMLRGYEAVRVRRWTRPDREVLRIAETQLDCARQLASVTYTVCEWSRDSAFQSLIETHINRFFLVQEMAGWLTMCGFDPLKWFAGLTPREEITEETWHIVAVARRAGGARQVRVGVWAAGFAPEDGGGYTFQTDILDSLAVLAKDSHHRFTILLAAARGAPSNGRRLGDLKIVHVPGPSAIERAADELYPDSWLVRRLRRRPSRLETIARAEGTEFMWFVGPTVLRVDLPYMLVVWDLQHRLQPWFPEVSRADTWFDREGRFAWHLRRAAVVVVGTDAGRREVEQLYQVPADHIRLLPHPTPNFALQASAGDDRSRLAKFGLQPGFLFYPAQFWPHKNHANLLLAIRKLRDDDGLVLTLVCVGSDRGNRAYTQRLAETLGVAEQVRILGFVAQEDLVALYRQALALVYVSFFGPENFPPLEAFALECPVIAANVPGAEEQLGQAALLVDPRSPGAIAGAIETLQEDGSLRRALIERGRARALRWTAHDFVRGALSILDDFEAVRRCWDR